MKKFFKSLIKRLAKSLAALAVVASLISPTDVKFSTPIWFLIIGSVIFFTVYWHIVDVVYDSNKRIQKYFSELRKDVKYIKEQVSKNKEEKK